MGLNWNCDTSYFFVDKENKMMLMKNINGELDNGKYDSIEKACHAYYAYKDERFLDGIKSCFKKVKRTNKITKFLFGDYYYQAERYPVPFDGIGPISRDHVSYAFSAMKLSGMSNKDIFEYTSHIRLKISDMATMTPGMWFWFRLISGKKIGYLYYPWSFLEFSFYKGWNKLLDKIWGFSDECTQDTYQYITVPGKPKLLNDMVQTYFPTYALKITTFQLDVLPENKWTSRLKKICLSMVQKHNYLLQLMLDDPNGPTKEVVENYKPMTGDRWSDILNSWKSDRYLRLITEPEWMECNILDVDLLKSVFERKNKNK